MTVVAIKLESTDYSSRPLVDIAADDCSLTIVSNYQQYSSLGTLHSTINVTDNINRQKDVTYINPW